MQCDPNDYKARVGKEVSITRSPRVDLEEALAKNPEGVSSALLLSIWLGPYPAKAGLDDGEFQQGNPKRVIDVIKELCHL